MKKFKIAFLISALFLISPMLINAQVSVNINIGSQPTWGPEAYDYVDYYYMPELGIYYNVPNRQYIYRHGKRWIYAYNLPVQYRRFNLYNTYKVVINEPRPYLRHNYYSSHYKKYKNYQSKQVNRRDSHNPRYNKSQSSKSQSHGKMSKSSGNDNHRKSNVVTSKRSNVNQKSQGKQGNQKSHGKQGHNDKRK